MKKSFKILMYSLLLVCMFFIASCTRKIYTITFIENGGSEVSDIEIPVNEIPELPNALEKEGYTFGGWYLDENLKFKYSASKVEGNMTLYAKWTVKSYTLSFETNGGNQVSNLTINFGQEIELPEAPSKAGHDFVGWYTDSALKEEFELTTMPAKDVKLYAAWDAYDYTVKFISNDEEIEELRQTVEYGQKATQPENPTREGYTFKGWYSGEEAYDFNSVMKKDVVLIAQWEINSYTITFDSNGGSSVEEATYNYGAVLTEPSRPTKEGYTFDCWKLNGESYSFVGKTMPANNITLVASWLAGNYTVYFNANAANASGTVASIGVHYDEEFEIPQNEYSLTGYTFAGWNSEPDGNGDSFVVGSKVSNLISEDNGSFMIYAQWTANTYSVKYDSNGGTGTMENSTMTYDVEKGLSANMFSKVGYTFAGWSLTSTGSVRYGNEDTVSNLAPSGEVTLYAVWTANNYSVAYNANTGSGTMFNQEREYDDGQAIKTNTFTKLGYTFAGWNTQADGKGQEISVDTTANLTAEEGSVVTLYAQWTANSYTIKFDGNGATKGAMESQERKYDDGVAIKTNSFEKTGYTFDGWLLGNKEILDGDATNLTSENGAEITLVAQWTAIQYTIKFDYNGGEGSLANLQMTYDQENSLPATIPTLEGHSFAGWEYDGKTYQANEIVKNLSSESGEEITLVAQWSRNSYNLTIKYNNGQENTVVSYLYEEEIESIEDAEKEGTVFKGWYTEDGEEFNFVGAKMPAYDFTIVAAYLNEVYVFFNLNYPNAGGFESLFGVQGEDVVAPTTNPERKGYEFAGWYAEQACNTEYEFTVFPAENVTVYAKWTPITYNVAFDVNDGDGTYSTIEMTYDSEKALPSVEPTREGYEFAGWTIADKTYQAGQMVMNLPGAEVKDQTVTLVAKWTAYEYTVSYNANTGEGTMASEPRRVDDGLAIKTNTFTKTGYTFAGWNTQADGKGQVVNNNTTETLTTVKDATITLYAQWTQNEYTIKFDGNGATKGSMSDQNRKYNDNTAIKSNGFEKDGYTFAGWLLENNEVEANSTENLTELVGKENVANAEITLKAKWVANTYTVIFNANDALATGTMQNQTFTYDDAKGLNPNLFTKVGYSFAGWAKSRDGSVEYENEKEVINLAYSGTITLYAKWEADTYTVIFQHGQTVESVKREVKYDGELSLANTFSYTGYTFGGWLLHAGNRNAEFDPDVASVVFNKDNIRTINTELKKLTLTAKWDANDIYINFYDASSDSNEPVATITRKYGDSYSKLADAEKENWAKYGYKYIGAYTNKECTEKVEFTGNQNKIYSDLDLYFKWEPTYYTVKFIVDGQSVFTVKNQYYLAEGIGDQFNDYIDKANSNLVMISKLHGLVLGLSAAGDVYRPVFENVVEDKIETTTPDGTTFEAGFIDEVYEQYPDIELLINNVLLAFTGAINPDTGDPYDVTDTAAKLYGYVNNVKLDLEAKSTMFNSKINGFYVPSKEGYICEGWVLGEGTAYDDEHQKGSAFDGRVPASTDALADGTDVRIVAKWTGVDAIELSKNNFNGEGEIKKLTWNAVEIDENKYESYSVAYEIYHETSNGTRKLFDTVYSDSKTTIEYIFNTSNPNDTTKPYFAPGTYRIRIVAKVSVTTKEGAVYNLVSEDAKEPLVITIALNGLVDEDLIEEEITGSYYYKISTKGDGLDVFYFYTGYNYEFSASNYFELLDGENGSVIDENDYVAISENVISTKDKFGTFHFQVTKNGQKTQYLAYVLPVVSQFDFGEAIKQYNALSNNTIDNLYQLNEKQDYVIGISTNSNQNAEYIIYKDVHGEEYTSTQLREMSSDAVAKLGALQTIHDNGFKFDIALKTANGETINTADYKDSHLVYKFYDVETGKDITSIFGYERDDIWYINKELYNREFVASGTNEYNLSSEVVTGEALEKVRNRKYRVEISVYKYYVPNALLGSVIKPITFEFKLNESINVYSNEVLKAVFADTTISNGINIHANIEAALNSSQLFYEGDSWSDYGARDDAARSDSYGKPANVHADVIMARNKPNGTVYQRVSPDKDLNDEQYQINGNYFTIDGENLPYTDTHSIGNLSSVPGYKIANVQMSIFGYYVSENYLEVPMAKSNASLNVSNLRVIGNSKNSSLEMDGISLMNKNSGGYIGIKSSYGSTMNLYNTIVQNTNIGVFVSAGSSANLNYITTSSCWSNSIYGHGSKTVEIRNSYLKDSGGAAIHLEDTLSTANENYRVSVKDDIVIGEKSHNVYSSVYFDETTTFENYVSGEEGYFKANSIELLVMKLKSQFDTELKPLNYTVLNQAIKKEEAVEKINFILLMPPAGNNKDGDGDVIKDWGLSGEINGAKTNYMTLNVGGYYANYCTKCKALLKNNQLNAGNCPICNGADGSMIIPLTMNAHFGEMDSTLLFNENDESNGYSIVPYSIPGFGNSVIVLGAEEIVNP